MDFAKNTRERTEVIEGRVPAGNANTEWMFVYLTKESCVVEWVATDVRLLEVVVGTTIVASRTTWSRVGAVRPGTQIVARVAIECDDEHDVKCRIGLSCFAVVNPGISEEL